MRRFLWLLCLLPVWAACSCDGDGQTGDARGQLVSEVELEFPDTFIGDKNPLVIELKNGGRTNVSAWVDAIPHGYSLHATKDNPVAVGPSGTTKVEIVFSPDAVGRFDGELTLAVGGATNQTLTVKLRGKGLDRDLLVQSELPFGVVPVHQSSKLSLPIKSQSEGDLTLKVSLGKGEKNFHIETAAVQLPAQGEASLDVTFIPLSEGSHSGRLSIATCDDCPPQYYVMLRGEGGHSNLRADPPLLTFGSISPGKRQALELRLINLGNMPVNIGRAAFLEGTNEAFSNETELEAAVGIIEKDKAKLTTVTFAPPAGLTELGVKSGSIAFYDDKDQLILEVPLQGTVGGPDVSVTPLSVDYGVVPLRVQSRRIVTITNVGNRAPAMVEEIFVRGSSSRFSFRSPKGQRFPLEQEPINVEVFFQAPDDPSMVGDYSDTLVIRTNDDDSREITVALKAHAADIPPCDLRINPGQVRFGLVPAGVILDRDVEIFNQGISDCAVWDFGMAAGGAPSFSLVDPPGEKILASQQKVVLKLRFEPPLNQVNQLLTSAIVFHNSDPNGTEKRVEVSGYPSSHQIEVIPNPLDFGPVHIGRDLPMNLFVLNTGATATDIERFRVEPEGTNFRVAAGSAAPGTAVVPGVIGAGQRAPIRAAYLATVEGVETAELEIWVRGATEPIRVPMRAEGRDEPCGDLCEAPVAMCPPNERVLVNQKHTLIGEGFNSAGDSVSCTWSFNDRPFGSREPFTTPGSCNTEFTPDMVGDYKVDLTVTDPQGKHSTCQTILTAVPHGGLWVEMFWERASDVDLHLAHPLSDPGLDSTWWSTNDCYYGGRNRDWDGGGDASASLDRDDVSNTGPENIRINRPVVGHAYAVGVHWYSNGPGHASNLVTTNVYCGGIQVAHEEITMNVAKDFVLVGTVQNNGIAGCTWTSIGQRWRHP